MTVDIPHEVGLLLVLRRVERGRVTVLHDGFADNGRPFPQVLLPFLRVLVQQGRVRVESREEEDPRAVLTAPGVALLAELAKAGVEDGATE